jgi:hypothetical protein
MRSEVSPALFSKEMVLLQWCIKSTPHVEPLHDNMLSEIDWPKFLKLASHHRSLPLVHAKLQECKQSLIPNQVLQSLAKSFLKNTLRMLKLSAEMEQICKTLNAHGIRTIMLKGPVLAEDLYGNLSLRSSKDLDILIPLADLDHADTLLTQMGYIKDQPLPGVLGDWKWRCHHDIYDHYGKRINIEIHWRLHSGPMKEPSFDELWERKRVSPLTSHPIYFMGREDLFIYLMYHGARHGWYRLRWLADIDRLVNQPLEWKKVKACCHQYGLANVAGQALLLASQLLQTPIAEPVGDLTERKKALKLAQDAWMLFIGQKVKLEEEPLSSSDEWIFRKYLFSLRSTRQQMIYILSLFYPSPLDAEVVPLPKRLHFLYFIMRPVLLLWRKMRGVASPQEGY